MYIGGHSLFGPTGISEMDFKGTDKIIRQTKQNKELLGLRSASSQNLTKTTGNKFTRLRVREENMGKILKKLGK